MLTSGGISEGIYEVISQVIPERISGGCSEEELEFFKQTLNESLMVTFLGIFGDISAENLG